MNQPIKNLQEAPSLGSTQTAKPRSGRRFVLTFLVLLAVVGGIVWWTKQAPSPEPGGRGRNSAPMSIVPEAVGKGDIGININALGTVTSLATVTIRTQISGYLQKIDFTEGDEVKKGDLIAQIDPRPYEAALAQARGQLARDEAALKGAQSTSPAIKGWRHRTPSHARHSTHRLRSSRRTRARWKRTE